MEDYPEELPEYSPHPASRMQTCTGSLNCEHRYALRDSRGHDWLSFVVKSRAADSKFIPVFLGGDTIKGEVRLDLGKTKTLKGLTVTIRAWITILGQEEDIFLHKTEPIWIPVSSKETKVIGKRAYPFSISLPHDVIIQPISNATKKRFLLPPTFNERSSPVYIDYRLSMTARRGRLGWNTKLSTSFTFLPRTVANPPSPLRALAYAEGGIIPGPAADPEGWKVSEPVKITGTLFNARDVSVQCTLAIAAPLTYASNSPIPLLLTLRGTDVLALDLFARAPNLQLLRTITIGSEAALDSETKGRRNNNTFVTSITKATFWPHEGDAGAECGRRTDEQQTVRVLRGEMFVPTGSRLSFTFPRFTCMYSLALLPPQVSGFALASAPEDPLLTERVTITMANASGVIPSSQIPPAYEAPITEAIPSWPPRTLVTVKLLHLSVPNNVKQNHFFSMNANFPAGLSISHSSFPSTSQFNLCSLGVRREDSFGFLGAEAQDTAIAKYGMGLVILLHYHGQILLADRKEWYREAAYAMMLYVCNSEAYEFDPRFDVRSGDVAVELGAGTGIAGLALASAHLHANVLLTDLPEVCPLLQANARGHTGVTVRPLAWGCVAHTQALRDELGVSPISHVICSDLVYFPELLAPLLRSLLHLTDPASVVASTQVVISYMIRSLSKETAFWSAFGLWFTFVPVLVRSTHFEDSNRWERFGAGGDGEVFVFVARRRPESFLWTVPEDDVALLEGVGARGTQERKSDDTFELLLLMSVEE